VKEEEERARKADKKRKLEGSSKIGKEHSQGSHVVAPQDGSNLGMCSSLEWRSVTQKDFDLCM
jgi:hypothetical protein